MDRTTIYESHVFMGRLNLWKAMLAIHPFQLRVTIIPEWPVKKLESDMPF